MTGYLHKNHCFYKHGDTITMLSSGMLMLSVDDVVRCVLSFMCFSDAWCFSSYVGRRLYTLLRGETGEFIRVVGNSMASTTETQLHRNLIARLRPLQRNALDWHLVPG